MKKLYLSSLMSLFIGMGSSDASEQVDCLLDTLPNQFSSLSIDASASEQICDFLPIQTNRLPTSKEVRDEEWKYLLKGITSFQKEQYEEAYPNFINAIDVNGSPLAYLYAAIFEDENNFHRYLLIAALAKKHGAIDGPVYDQHVSYLVSKGHLIGVPN